VAGFPGQKGPYALSKKQVRVGVGGGSIKGSNEKAPLVRKGGRTSLPVQKGVACGKGEKIK